MKKKLWICTLTLTMLILTVPMVPANACHHRRRPIIILRDDYGVPHIYANTKEGLAYGCGYVIAQDRLWQADVFRRAAFGRLAEIGLAEPDDDYETRAVGYSWEELGEIFDNWVPTNPKAKLKEMMLAYVDGINEYITEATNALLGGDPSLMPVEYLAYGLLPEPWTIEDSTAIMAMMAWRFGGTGGNELQFLTALQAFQAAYGDEIGWGMFNDHFPQNDPGAEVTIPEEEGTWPDVWQINSWKKGKGFPKSLGNEYYESQMRQTELYESLGLPTKFGSNALVVGPKNSKSRNTLELGGPQMGQSIPQIMLEVGLHGAGIDAVGAMLPFAPTIILGVSKYGAWTSTTGVSDVMDTYIEILNPDNHSEYLFNGQYIPMEVRTEVVYGLFRTFDVTFPVYRTIHGPVVSWDHEHNLCVTIKSPFYKNDMAAEEGWLHFQEAKNIGDMHLACSLVQPNHNFYWVDTAGNIGYWHSGAFPVKPTTGIATEDFPEGRPIDDRLPLYGTGEEEWVRVTGPSEMPVCINPKQGWLANWNNKPIANWPYAESDAGWGEGHRVSEIMDMMNYLLVMKGKLTLDDLNTINMAAGYHHAALYQDNRIGTSTKKILDDLLAAAITAPPDPLIDEALSYLQLWNHYYNDIMEPRWPNPGATYDDPGLTIFEDWYERMINETFQDDLPDFPEIGPIHREFAQVWPSTLIHVLDGPDSKLELSYDYLNGEEKNDVIIKVLKWTIGNLTEQYPDPNMGTWLTPVENWIPQQLGALPNSYAVMPFMNRGTYNQLAEMPRKKWWHRFWNPAPNAYNVIPPGQNGFVNYLKEVSPHAYDQLMLYITWNYKPMRYHYWDIWKVKESVEILYY